MGVEQRENLRGYIKVDLPPMLVFFTNINLMNNVIYL